MINHLLLKFALVFVGGAGATIVVTQVILPYFLKTETPPLIPRQVSPPTNVLGETSDEKENKAKTFAQGLVNKVVDSFAKSEAVKPIVETTQSVQKAVDDVKSLPDTQKAAICKEICSNQ